MKYLLIEDSDDKRLAITKVINVKDTYANIDHVGNLSDARRLILTRSYDLIIFDIFMPERSGGIERDVAEDIISDFAQSVNVNCEAIAITKYVEEGLQRSPLFNDNGITIVVYDAENSQWQESLARKVLRVCNRGRFDFVIFCALNKERMAYSETSATVGQLKQLGDLDCQEINIGNHRGVCVKPSRMGLVNMAIATSKAIELFRPKIIAMSGICAGVEGESNFLDIVIGDVCWEYQTGKFKDGKFYQEPYQASLKRPFKIELEQFSKKEGLLSQIKAGLYETELKHSEIKCGLVSSGSAVVADEKKMQEIGLQHRKWTSLEMEMYAMYEAAAQSSIEPLCFGAKAVVDMGDSSKGDVFHSTASIISARFVIEFLKHKLPTLNNT